MAYTSPTTVNMSKGFGEMLNYTNTVTDGWISNMVLIAIWVIVLMGFYKAKDDFTGALAVAGYGTFVVALLFWLGGFISGIVLGTVIAVAVIGTIVLLMDQSN
jgi:hypothetical protein